MIESFFGNISENPYLDNIAIKILNISLPVCMVITLVTLIIAAIRFVKSFKLKEKKINKQSLVGFIIELCIIILNFLPVYGYYMPFSIYDLGKLMRPISLWSLLTGNIERLIAAVVLALIYIFSHLWLHILLGRSIKSNFRGLLILPALNSVLFLIDFTYITVSLYHTSLADYIQLNFFGVLMYILHILLAAVSVWAYISIRKYQKSKKLVTPEPSEDTEVITISSKDNNEINS